LGYTVIGEEEDQPDPPDWNDLLWKLNFPMKICLLFSMVLSHKVPTWENKLSLFWQGPNICPLCKGFLDECDNIFVHCSYIREMWDLASYTYNVRFLWQGVSIEETFMDWHNLSTFEEFQALPTIFIHGVWTAQNLAIF
jgi:hypothetical protein